MRLFAAVELPAEQAALLRNAVETARATRGAEAVSSVRWSPEHQWHVTVAFYGQVPNERVSELCMRLGRAAGRTATFSLRLGAVSTFPNQSRRARVLVVRVAGDEEALQTLARRAEAAGRRCGVPVPERAYRPHVTLARARGESADMSALVTAFTGFATEPWMARRLLLYRSHLGPVPRHEQLAEWPFASS